jgi:hypothetical protein
MQATKQIIWSKDRYGEVMHFTYQGATVQVRRYPGPEQWGWNFEHFIAINGDHYPYGVPYRTFGIAVRVAKHRITKGDFESSDWFLNNGSFSIQRPDEGIGYTTIAL